MNKKQPNPVDVHVGRKIREARILNDLSQTALAQKIGITFQQLQKYESGANRVSCSRLYELARALEMPVQAFFAEADGKEEQSRQPIHSHKPEGITLDHASAYSSLHPELRNQLSKTAKALALTTGKSVDC